MVKISTNPMKKRIAKTLRNKLRSNGYRVAMVQVAKGTYTIKAER